MQEGEFFSIWFYSPAVRAFESGRSSPAVFASHIIEELGLEISPDAFPMEFPDFISGYYPGAEALLETLSARRNPLLRRLP